MKNHTANVSGINVYSDIYGQPVYYNFLDKKGYIISEVVESKFKLIQSRFSIVVILLILFNDYFGSVANTVSVGAIILVIIEIYFRKVFLKNLKTVSDTKRLKRVSMIEGIVKSNDKQKIIMKTIAYIFFGVLIILNAIQENFELSLMILSGIVMLGSFYLAIVNLIAIRKINLSNK